MLPSGEGFEHGEMRGTWLVQTRQQSIKGADAALWGHHEAGPPFAGMHCSISVSDAFEGADGGRADGDNPVMCVMRGVDKLGSLWRHTIILFVGRFMLLKAGYASMEQQWRKLDTMP